MSGSDDQKKWPEVERRDRDDRRTGLDRRNEAGWTPVPVDPNDRTDDDLVAAAKATRVYAQADYSRFKVGAAIELPGGVIVTGCNVENATYGLTICAERVALVKALSEGHTNFRRIAVVADTKTPTPPCGPCRQLLWEYCGNIDIVIANLDGPMARYKLAALLPLPFDARLLR